MSLAKDIWDHTLRNPALKKIQTWVGLLRALMGSWFTFLECSQEDFGQLTHDSFLSYVTQTYVLTSNELEMNPGRASAAHSRGWRAVSVPWEDPASGRVGVISGTGWGKVHAFTPKQGSQVNSAAKDGILTPT